MPDKERPQRPPGLLDSARRLARAAVTRALERLTGMPLSGDPWAPRKALEPTQPQAQPAPQKNPRRAATEAVTTTPRPTPAPAQAIPAPAAPAPAPAAAPHPPLVPADAQAPVPPPPPAPPPPAPPEEPLGILDFQEPPERYGRDELAVFARDPGTLFFYWEVTPSAWDRARAELQGDGSLVARFTVTAYRGGSPITYVHDEPLTWDHGRRIVPAPEAGAHVTAAVGLIGANGRFAAMVHAPAGVRVPPGVPGPVEPVEWMEVAPAGPPGERVGAPQVLARGPGVIGPAGERAGWAGTAWVIPRGRRVPAWGALEPTSGETPGTVSSWPSSPSPSSPSPSSPSPSSPTRRAPSSPSPSVRP